MLNLRIRSSTDSVSCWSQEHPPPPRGGFFVWRFPNQEPGVRGPPLKNHSQNWSVSGVIRQGGSSSTGFLVWKPRNKETHPGEGGSFNQCLCLMLASQIWMVLEGFETLTLVSRMFHLRIHSSSDVESLDSFYYTCDAKHPRLCLTLSIIFGSGIRQEHIEFISTHCAIRMSEVSAPLL